MPPIAQLHFNLGNVEINLDSPDAAVAAALANNQPFPAQEISVAGGKVKLSASRDIKLDGGKGSVTFSGSASAYSALGVYQSGENLLKALQAADLEESLAEGLRIPADGNSNLLLLRWGYDASASAHGEVALGAGLGATFGVDAGAEGLFAVVRRLPRDAGSRDAVTRTVNSWKLPRQVGSPADIEPGTWLIAETGASVALSLGIQYGYNFNWVHEAVALGGLTGDIGLKVEASAMATLGFEAAGRFAVVLSRESESNNVRLRVFNLKRKGWSFAAHAAVGAQFDPGGLAPEKLDDLIKGVLNVQGLQVIKDIEHWIDPSNTVADLLGAKLIDEAELLLEHATGIDPRTAFNEALDRLQGLIKKWHDLPHDVMSALYFLLRDRAGEVDTLRTFLRRVVELATPEEIAKEIEGRLSEFDFMTSAVGRWLTAAAGRGIVSLLNSTSAVEEVHDLAQKTLALLDGSLVEDTLKRLQQWVEERLGLDKIIGVVSKADFDQLNDWLKARLSDFLGKVPGVSLIFEELEKIKATIKALRDKAQEFYAKGLTALTRKYTAEFTATYQKTTTRTALLDAEFEFGGGNGDAAVSGYLREALDGNFNTFMLRQLPGVRLHKGKLTHEIKRHSHIEVSLPYYTSAVDHINDSLAQANAVDTADGRLLMYDLDARDLVARRNRRNSQLAVGLHFTRDGSTVRRFSKETYSYDYSLRIVQRDMKQQFLRYQFQDMVVPYFGDVFEAPGSKPFDTYVSDLDRAVDAEHPGTDNMGNALISLNVSVPGSTLAAWQHAPLQDNDPKYMKLSMALQAKLRQLIPLCYFQDASKYGTLGAAIPLLVYSSLQVANHVTLDGSGKPKFDSKEDIYWNWVDDTSDGVRSAVIRYPGTVQKLMNRLAGVRRVLAATPGMQGKVGFYQDSEIPKMLRLVIEDKDARMKLSSLLFVEVEVIQGAREAGQSFAKFFGEPKPDKALKYLADFGAHLTDTFNNKISSIYQGDALRALGTMAFVEAARALDESQEPADPTALLDLIILRQQAKFVPEQFLKDEWPTKDDYFLAQQLINVGTQGE
jgi:hypothetical protein